MAQIYKLMNNNWANIPIIRYLSRRKRATINQIKLEAEENQRSFWKTMLEHLSKERLLNPKYIWTKIKPINSKSGAAKMRITDTGNRRGNLITDKREIEPKFWEEMIRKYTRPPDENIARQVIIETERFHEDNPDFASPLPTINIARLLPGHELLQPFVPREVKNIFNSFKNKAPGADAVRRTHTDHFPKSLIVILTMVFNYCLATGYYPQKFKKGLMIFIAKPGKDPSTAKNYRPITLLDIIGKGLWEAGQ